MEDATTLFEIDVLTLVKDSPEYLSKFKKPLILGPDRRTVQHTANTLSSYKPSENLLRSDYRSYVDIVGTQARYMD